MQRTASQSSTIPGELDAAIGEAICSECGGVLNNQNSFCAHCGCPTLEGVRIKFKKKQELKTQKYKLRESLEQLERRRCALQKQLEDLEHREVKERVERGVQTDVKPIPIYDAFVKGMESTEDKVTKMHRSVMAWERSEKKSCKLMYFYTTEEIARGVVAERYLADSSGDLDLTDVSPADALWPEAGWREFLLIKTQDVKWRDRDRRQYVNAVIIVSVEVDREGNFPGEEIRHRVRRIKHKQLGQFQDAVRCVVLLHGCSTAHLEHEFRGMRQDYAEEIAEDGSTEVKEHAASFLDIVKKYEKSYTFKQIREWWKWADPGGDSTDSDAHEELKDMSPEARQFCIAGRKTIQDFVKDKHLETCGRAQEIAQQMLDDILGNGAIDGSLLDQSMHQLSLAVDEPWFQEVLLGSGEQVCIDEPNRIRESPFLGIVLAALKVTQPMRLRIRWLKNAADVSRLADALFHDAWSDRLQELVLEYCCPRPEGVQSLVKALNKCAALVMLGLQRCNICKNGAKELAEALPRLTALEQLRLGWNRIGAEGAAYLAQALPQVPKLSELDLDGNSDFCIGDAGVKSLASCLEQCRALESLSLEKNGIGDEGAKVLLEVLKGTSTLKRLKLQGNDGIGEEVSRRLKEAANKKAMMLEL